MYKGLCRAACVWATIVSNFWNESLRYVLTGTQILLLPMGEGEKAVERGFDTAPSAVVINRKFPNRIVFKTYRNANELDLHAFRTWFFSRS